jgi:hypothetical protein
VINSLKRLIKRRRKHLLLHKIRRIGLHLPGKTWKEDEGQELVEVT